MITSSTGDGEPPENALLLWKKLQDKNLSCNHLSHIKYALLGLGDSNYTTFGGFPKSLDRQLLKLGAKKIYEFGLADDAVGLEIVVDPWIEKLWDALKEQKNYPDHQNDSVKEGETSIPHSSVEILEGTVNDKPPSVEIIDTVSEIESCLTKLSSLTISLEPLNQCNLKIPVLPQSYLEMTFNLASTVCY